jgi:hypothetical protein
MVSNADHGVVLTFVFLIALLLAGPLSLLLNERPDLDDRSHRDSWPGARA